MSVGRRMASGAFTDVLSMTSRARCITPCSDDGWQHDCSVTGLASSAYTASDETYTTCAGGTSPRAWQTTSPILTLAVTSAAARAGATPETTGRVRSQQVTFLPSHRKAGDAVGREPASDGAADEAARAENHDAGRTCRPRIQVLEHHAHLRARSTGAPSVA